jgi:elongation factor G
MKAYFFEGPNGEDIKVEEIPAKYKAEAEENRKVLIETVADVNEKLEEEYLCCEDPVNEISVEQLKKAIRESCISRKFSPVFIGSAIKNKGVQLALDGVIDFLPNPLEKNQKAWVHKVHPELIKQDMLIHGDNYQADAENKPQEIVLEKDLKKPFVGMAFKLQESKYGQLTFMRCYQGTLKRGDILNMVSQRKKIKISRMVKMHSDEMVEIHECQLGEIFALFGIDCYSGETFTREERIVTLDRMHVPEVVMSLSIKPRKTEFIPKFLKAITRFQKEDPTFRVSQNEETEEMIMSGMGELHLQVYAERIRREYEIDVDVGTPQVNFRESIEDEGHFNFLHKKQSGGSGQFARVIGKIEPLIEDFSLAEDKRNQFVNATGGQSIPNEYIPAIEKAFHEICKRGPLMGSPVIGVKYVLEDGQIHAVDSSSLAFSIATKYSMTQAFENCTSVLLEPCMDVEVSGPAEYQNGIMNTITKRKGNVYDMTTKNDIFICYAEVSLRNMFGYATELRSVSQGVGEFSMEYKFHLPVPAHELDDILEAKRIEIESKRSQGKGKGGFGG